MVKIVLLKIIYCIGFIVGSFGSDVKEIGSSISFAVASGSVIENSKSFSHVRAKRALALLVPFDDEDESSEEHHKSKRCWRARPVQKTRLSIEPGDETEEYTEGSESGSVRGAEYNLNKLYDKKRSVEKLEDESYASRESHEDDSGKKLPYFKILPVKNHRKIIKQFLGTDREMKNDAASRESKENSEELILKKIKHHINSDDYNVLALVGKRANNHPKANRPKKYICYCREADCSGGNCQRMMYRPCSTCKNFGPGFIGMANNKYRLHGGRNDNENQEIQTNEARVPLKIQYPVTKNKFIEYPVNNDVELRKNLGTSSPMNAVNKFDQKNYQQNLPATQDKRYQFSHEPPRGVLVNRNNYVKPLNPYYPSIGNAGNSDTNNKNHDINRQNFFKLYQSDNRFSGPEIQFPNQGMAAFPQSAAAPGEFQARKNFDTMKPKMTTNLHPISNTVLYNKYHDANGFGWNIPHAKEAQSHPQLQHIQTQDRALGYQEKLKSSSIQDDSQFEFEADGYDVSTENNFDSSSSSETDNYTHSSKSEENYSRDSDYEDITEEQFIDDPVSIGHNVAHTEDHRNVYYAEVSDAPERYKLPLIPVEKVDPSTDPVIIGNENPNYDRDTGYSIDETTFRTQLEQPENEQSNWDNHNEDTTPQVIIRPDSNEQASSTYNDQLNTPESLEDSQLAEAEPRNSDLEESGQVLTGGEKVSESETGSDYSDIQVITNGYFTSEANDDFGETTNDGDILVTEIGWSHDLNSNEEESYGPYSSENQMESGLQNENVSLTVDETTTADYIGYRNSGSSSNQQLAHEEFDEPSIGAKNRLLEGDMNKIITVTQASSLEDDEVIDATPTLISNLGVNKHLQTTTEREYSSSGSAESNELNLDSNSLESNEEIESSKVTEIFSTEAVGKKETDSAEYETGTSEAGDYYEPDSSMGEDTPIPNEEDVREADNHSSSLPEDGNSLEESSRPKSIESVDDDSYLENDFIDYSSEDSPAVLSEKKSESPDDELVGLKSNNDAQDYEMGNYKIDDEPADVGIENSPTKYFSPNDRVLEYMKKHSQNLVGCFDPDNDEQLRTQATPIYSTTAGRESQYFTPEIYHTKLGQDESAEQYFQGFNSGSESEEIITQPSSILDDHSNPNYKTAEHQTVKYSTQPIGNDFFTDEENYSATEPIDESIATQIPIKDLSDYDYDSIESTKSSVLPGGSRELKLGLDDEKSGITHLQKGISNHNYYDYADSTEISRSTEESVESIRDYSKEILSATEHTQYNDKGNEESDRETSSSYNNRIAGEKSTAKNYYNDKKVLDNDSSSDENMNTLGAQDYGRINAEGNSSPEMNSRKNSFDKTELNQYVRGENYATQSTTKNLRPDVGIDPNKFVLQEAGETEGENHSNFPDNDNDGHDADIVRYYNPIELQESSTETTTKNLRKDSNYYTTQATQYADDIYLRSSEALYKSPLKIKSKDNLSEGYKSKKDSGIINNVELVSSSQSLGCCTKPPEVRDDAGYLGRLEPKNSNANVKSLGDLVESDLYYIGDGVKLPLTIKKLKDGSFALSISDRICKHLSEGKCPCCVPREGRILQEKRSEENDEESTGKNDISLRRWGISAIPDDEDSEIDRVELDDGKTLNVKQYERMSEPDLIVLKKNRDHKRRATRSISMPVDEFAEKYNLILNLNDNFATGATVESFLRNNVIQRDQVTDDTQQDDSDFIPKVVLINDVPESERASLLLSTLQELIETEPKDAVNGMKNKLRGIKSAEYDQEEGESGGQKARYGYQRDNPILDKIRIIKQLRNEANRCEHRYQKDCNDAITQKTELLTMILNWLKDLVTIERTYLT